MTASRPPGKTAPASPNWLDVAFARRRLAKAAGHPTAYDQATLLQREVATRMAERLQYVKLSPAVVVDAGAGTGSSLAHLHKRFPDARLVALDTSLVQLRRARASAPAAAARKPGQVPRWLRGLIRSDDTTHAVAADFSRLPLATASVGCLWSNLALQWVDDPVATFAEWHRVVTSEGLVLFSTLGPDTLKELRAAWSLADQSSGGPGTTSRIHPFIDMHDIGDMLAHAGFADPVMDMETITLTYPSVDALVGDLRGAGAVNAHLGRPRGLTGRRRWQAMRAAYEAMRSDGKLPATFEVVYGHAWKPQPRARAGEDGIARVRIEDIGRPRKPYR